MGVAEKLDDAIARCAGRGVPDLRIALEESRAEIERLQAAKRGALQVADERSIQNVELRAENARLRAALGIARTAFLKIERQSEEIRAEISRSADEQSTGEQEK